MTEKRLPFDMARYLGALRRFVWNLTSQATMDKDVDFWQSAQQRISR